MHTKMEMFAVLLLALTLGDHVRAEDDTVGPTFIKEPPNKIDFSNSTGATLECTARGNPAPEIIWLRSDGTAVGDVPGLRQVLPNGNLVFPPFRAEDYRQEVHAQAYICMARNSVGSIHSRDVNVRAVVSQAYAVNVLDEYVLRGNPGILKCHIPSFVADYVYVEAWIQNEKVKFTLENSRDYESRFLVLPSGELHIRDVVPEDGFKSYQCRTKHKLTGETRLSATKGRLVITEPVGFVRPKFSKLSKSNQFEYMESEKFALLCEAQSYPVPMFRWYKFIEGSNRKISVTLNDRVKQVSGTLIIQEAKVEDSGKYLCVVNNSVGGESVETVLTVTAPLSATVEPIVQTVDFGRPAVLTCNYEGNPVKTVSWLKDGKPISANDGRNLKIESVRKDDKGMYQCFVRNEQESAQASAEVKLGGRFDPPQIIQAFAEEVLKVGPSVYLKCVASGNPTPEITWFLDSKKIDNSEKFRISNQVTATGDKISYLNITEVQTNDGGLYQCEAVSKVGTASHSARLNVHGLPHVRPMEKKMIVAGGTLVVTCPFAGYPIDSVTWERDSRTLPINRKQKVFPNGTLIIENVERQSDQATYTCLAKNSNGYSARGNLEVQVLVSPHISPFEFESPVYAGENVQVTCHVPKGDKPLNIRWRFENHTSGTNFSSTMVGDRANFLSIASVGPNDAGNYTCIAENSAGVDYYTAPLAIIAPPEVQPFAFGDTPLNDGDTLQVACTVPKGDLPITVNWFFNGQLLKSDDNMSVSKIGPRATFLSITSVGPMHSGNYTCRAENSGGSNQFTAPLQVNGITCSIDCMRPCVTSCSLLFRDLCKCSARHFLPIQIFFDSSSS